MSEEVVEEPEFTKEQLLAALKQVGSEARQQAFASGLPVYFVRKGSLIALYANGSEKVIKRIPVEASTESIA